MPRFLTTRSGTSLELHDELGRGGEGIVYRVRNRADLAVKVYHPDKISVEHRRKLQVMVELANDNLIKHSAWPVDLIERGAFGVVMPLVNDPLEIHDVYGPKSRMAKLPQAGFKFLLLVGYNLCVAVKHVHAAGVVIGDFNQRNILVGQDARVRFVDCDSFQVRHGNELFRCLVGTPDQMAPEVHGKPLEHLIRDADHDNFTLAVVIFQLLFAGRHPFAGVGGPDLELPEAIRRHHYAYGGHGAKSGIRPPPHAPPLDLLPPSLTKLFERAFSLPQERLNRPTPDEWARALAYALEHIVPCKHVSNHEFIAGRMTCPWCDIEARFQIVFFTGSTVTATGSNRFNLQDIARQILNIAAPTWTGRTTPRPVPAPVAAPLTSDIWPGAYWFGFVIVGVATWPLATGHWLIALLLGAWGAYTAYDAFAGADSPTAAARKAVNEARKDRDQLESEARRHVAAIDQQFKTRRSLLHKLKTQYENLGGEKTRQYAALRQQHVQLQLEQYLDKFFLEQASIPHIGERRKALLLSYHVETARDIRRGLGIPGFGSDLEDKLLAWRAELAQQFKFNPAQQIDPAEFRRIDAALATHQRELEQKILGLKDELQRAEQKARQELQQRGQAYDAADDVLVQKEAELAGTGQPHPGPGAAPMMVLAGWVVLLLVLIGVSQSTSRIVPSPMPAAPVSPPPAPSVGQAVLRPSEPALIEIYQFVHESPPKLIKRHEKTAEAVTVGGLPAGRYLLLAMAEGWRRPQRLEFEVRAGATQDIMVTFERFKVSFESVPSGATVTEDGKVLGTTPFVLPDVTAEKHSYVFQRANCPTQTVEAAVSNDSLRIAQTWPVGSLTISSEPSGAQVSQGSVVLGVTPLLLPQLAPARYDFTVTHPNHVPQVVSGNVTANQALNLVAKFVDSLPVKVLLEAAASSREIKLTNRSDRAARIRTVSITDPSGQSIAQLAPNLSLAPQASATLSMPVNLPADFGAKISIDGALVDLEIARSDSAVKPTPDSLFDPGSIAVELDNRTQTLRFHHRGKQEITIQRIELELVDGRVKQTIAVNKKLGPQGTLRVPLRTRPGASYSFQIVTEPVLPKGTVEFITR